MEILNSQAGFLDKSRWSAAGLDSCFDREGGVLKLEYWKKSVKSNLEIRIVKEVYPLVAISGLSNHDASIVQGFSGPIGTDWWIEVEGERLEEGDLDVERILTENVRKKAKLLILALYDALVSYKGDVGVFTTENVKIADQVRMNGGDADKCLHISYHPNKTLVCSVELHTGLFVLDSPQVQGREELFLGAEKEINVDLKWAREAFLRLRSEVWRISYL